MTVTEESVKIALEAEYKFLCLCDAFKAAFDEHAEDSGATTIQVSLYPTSQTVIVNPAHRLFISQTFISTSRRPFLEKLYRLQHQIVDLSTISISLQLHCFLVDL